MSPKLAFFPLQLRYPHRKMTIHFASPTFALPCVKATMQTVAQFHRCSHPTLIQMVIPHRCALLLSSIFLYLLMCFRTFQLWDQKSVLIQVLWGHLPWFLGSWLAPPQMSLYNVLIGSNQIPLRYQSHIGILNLGIERSSYISRGSQGQTRGCPGVTCTC